MDAEVSYSVAVPLAEASPVEARLPAKVSYGIGEIPITVTMVMFGLFVMFFYNSVMRLPGTLVGLASAVGLLWDAAVDPYIGYRSDRSRSRFGRRHGYMLAGAVGMGLFFWMLLSPPRGLGTLSLFAWLLTATIIFRLASAVYRIPYLSLGAEMSADYHGRTEIVGIRSFFGLLGTLAAGALSFALFFPNIVPGVDPKLDYASYPKMGLAFGLVMVICGLAAVFGTLEHRTRPAETVGGSSLSRQGSFWSGFAVSLRNRAFRSVWLSFTLFFFAVVFNGVLAIHYFTWYVDIRDSKTLSFLQACFYVGALIGVPVWVGIARSFEKKRLCLAAMGALSALLCAATLLFGAGSLFGTGNPEPLMAGNALAGFFASVLWVFPASMLADIVDQDEVRTGLRREGIFFGILNFGEKIAAGASLLASGVLLDYFVRLSPGAAQEPGTAARIGMLYGLLPAALVLFSGTLLWRYRLDRNAVREIQAMLERTRRGADSPLLRSPGQEA